MLHGFTVQTDERKQHALIRKRQVAAWQKAEADEGALPAKARSPSVRFQAETLLQAAAVAGDTEALKALLDQGVSPDSANADGLTPLHQVSIDDRRDLVRLLVGAGATVDARDQEEWTPLHAAASCGHVGIVEELLRHSADVIALNIDHETPLDLCESSEEDRSDVVRILQSAMTQQGLQEDDVVRRIQAREDDLMGEVQKASKSAKGPAALDSPVGPSGETLLHIAAAHDFLAVAKTLLDLRTNVEARDNDGWTPLHAAVSWGNVDAARLLIAAGADASAKTGLGEELKNLVHAGEDDMIDFVLRLAENPQAAVQAAKATLELAAAAKPAAEEPPETVTVPAPAPADAAAPVAPVEIQVVLSPARKASSQSADAAPSPLFRAANPAPLRAGSMGVLDFSGVHHRASRRHGRASSAAELLSSQDLQWKRRRSSISRLGSQDKRELTAADRLSERLTLVPEASDAGSSPDGKPSLVTTNTNTSSAASTATTPSSKKEARAPSPLSPLSKGSKRAVSPAPAAAGKRSSSDKPAKSATSTKGGPSSTATAASTAPTQRSSRPTASLAGAEPRAKSKSPMRRQRPDSARPAASSSRGKKAATGAKAALSDKDAASKRTAASASPGTRHKVVSARTDSGLSRRDSPHRSSPSRTLSQNFTKRNPNRATSVSPKPRSTSSVQRSAEVKARRAAGNGSDGGSSGSSTSHSSSARSGTRPAKGRRSVASLSEMFSQTDLREFRKEPSSSSSSASASASGRISAPRRTGSSDSTGRRPKTRETASTGPSAFARTAPAATNSRRSTQSPPPQGRRKAGVDEQGAKHNQEIVQLKQQMSAVQLQCTKWIERQQKYLEVFGDCKDLVDKASQQTVNHVLTLSEVAAKMEDQTKLLEALTTEMAQLKVTLANKTDELAAKTVECVSWQTKFQAVAVQGWHSEDMASSPMQHPFSTDI